jgi:hypothetical protein
MLKYKFKDKVIQISDNAANWLDEGYPKEVSIEVEDFSGENKALAFKSESSNEVYIVLPCGRRPNIRYNDCFVWNGFELIKKVDYRELERKEE